MAEDKKKEDKKPDRKPKDYDEKEVPKVLKGDVKSEPLRSRKDYGEDAAMIKEVPSEGAPAPKPVTPSMDYDSPCPCHQESGSPLSEEVSLPDGGGQGFITILVCPDCGNEGPFNMTPPAGISLGNRALKCAKCKTSIPFKGLVKTASGKYVYAKKDMCALADRIRGLVRQGDIMTWDIVNDIRGSLDDMCDLYADLKKRNKD